MRLVLYNPLSLSRSWRLEQILTTVRAEFFVFPGTGEKATREVPVRHRRLPEQHKYVIGWGWQARCSGSNKSCGVSIALPLSLEKKVVRVASPPVSVAGRGGSVQIMGGGLQLRIIGVYMPTKVMTSTTSWWPTVQTLLDWVRSELETTPARVTPVLALDLNDKLGLDSSGARS